MSVLEFLNFENFLEIVILIIIRGWRAVWFTIRNCEPGSQFCEPGSQFDIFVEPVKPGDSSKSLRGAHATS
jgi:hypothetical protein